MSGFKKFLYVIYSLLFLATIGMVLYNSSLNATFGESTMYTFWMFWSLLGFGLLMLESVFENIHLWSVKRDTNRLERENTQLKAKLYDLGSADRDRTVGRDRDTVVTRERTEVIDDRAHLDQVRMEQDRLERERLERERLERERLDRDRAGRPVYDDRPSSRDDIISARDEGDVIRVRESDGNEKIIYKDGRQRPSSR
jgi:hypothetical protein